MRVSLTLARLSLAAAIAIALAGWGGGAEADGDRADRADGGAGTADGAAADADAGGVGPILVEVPATATFSDTGLEVERGDMVEVEANGTISFADGATQVGPDGHAPDDSDALSVLRCPDHASLIGRLGEDGQPFPIGSQALFVATETDRLFLGVNDTVTTDNSGSFTARVLTRIRHRTALSDGASVPGAIAWTDTGIDVRAADVLTMWASGMIDNNIEDPTTIGPGGYPGGHDPTYNLLLCANHAAVLGKVDEAGAPFLVGRSYSHPVAVSGRLLLGINDNYLSDNDGKFSVAIELSERSP